MAPPFSLRFIANAPGKPPTILVNQDSSGLTIKSPHGQRLWDLSQATLRSLPTSGRTPASFFLRLSSSTRDHGRTYCTVRVPAQERKYLYKFFLGIGEWVLSAPPPQLPHTRPNGHIPLHASFTAQCPIDGFYGRRLAPINYDILWGLDGLLGASWREDHARVCRKEHWDVCISIVPAEAGGGQDPLAGLRVDGMKRFMTVRVCADAKVEALFQNLIGFERSTRWESLAHCLTEVVAPCGPLGEVRLGRRWSFEEVRERGLRMWETGWFEGKECVALVSSLSMQVKAKAKATRGAFMYD